MSKTLRNEAVRLCEEAMGGDKEAARELVLAAELLAIFVRDLHQQRPRAVKRIAAERTWWPCIASLRKDAGDSSPDGLEKYLEALDLGSALNLSIADSRTEHLRPTIVNIRTEARRLMVEAEGEKAAEAALSRGGLGRDPWVSHPDHGGKVRPFVKAALDSYDGTTFSILFPEMPELEKRALRTAKNNSRVQSGTITEVAASQSIMIEDVLGLIHGTLQA